MPQAGAVALARAAVAEPIAGPDRADPLTRRELEVAQLVAGGRTNRQIGRTLGIAEKTTEVHVHNIIRKLGACSRAEVAAWVARREA
jgi:non-specific serine/threonine protein kinase